MSYAIARFKGIIFVSWSFNVDFSNQQHQYAQFCMIIRFILPFHQQEQQQQQQQQAQHAALLQAAQAAPGGLVFLPRMTQ